MHKQKQRGRSLKKKKKGVVLVFDFIFLISVAMFDFEVHSYAFMSRNIDLCIAGFWKKNWKFNLVRAPCPLKNEKNEKITSLRWGKSLEGDRKIEIIFMQPSVTLFGATYFVCERKKKKEIDFLNREFHLGIKMHDSSLSLSRKKEKIEIRKAEEYLQVEHARPSIHAYC